MSVYRGHREMAEMGSGVGAFPCMGNLSKEPGGNGPFLGTLEDR